MMILLVNINTKIKKSIKGFTMAVSIRSISLTDKLTAIPEYDAIIIGAGIGGLVTATQLVAKGAKVIVLESYIIPGGSSGYFQRGLLRHTPLLFASRCQPDALRYLDMH